MAAGLKEDFKKKMAAAIKKMQLKYINQHPKHKAKKYDIALVLTQVENHVNSIKSFSFHLSLALFVERAIFFSPESHASMNNTPTAMLCFNPYNVTPPCKGICYTIITHIAS